MRLECIVNGERRQVDGVWEGGALSDSALDRFGELVAEAARPIDDVRSTAAYRVHALGVLARRTLEWAQGEERRR